MTMNYSTLENNEFTEYQNLSEEEKIKREKQIIQFMFNALQEELKKEYQNPHIPTLFEHAQLIAIKPGISNQKQ